jgi:hypothetical protein
LPRWPASARTGFTFADPLTLTHHRRIVAFATQHRLVMISELKVFAEAGGLMTYGPHGEALPSSWSTSCVA